MEARAAPAPQASFGRIVGFTDGVMAIAITLLVLSIEVPHGELSSSELADFLADERYDLLSYAISFAVIGRYWAVHHRFFAGLEHFDGRLIALNMLFLALIVLIPYPTEVLGDYSETVAATVFYAATMAAVGLVNSAMVGYAGTHHLARPDAERASSSVSLTIAIVFLISIPIAFAGPTAAKIFWVVALPARRIVVRRARSS